MSYRMYLYRTASGAEREELFGGPAPEVLIDPDGTAWAKQPWFKHGVPAVARSKSGPNENRPYFDRGLGMVVNNRKHAAEVAKSRGLVPLAEHYDDGGDAALDRGLRQYDEEQTKIKKFRTTYNEAHAKYGGDEVRAACEAFETEYTPRTGAEDGD